MNYLTQRLANKFARWTKIRRDPSSFGARVLSIFADILEEQSISNKWVQEESQLLKLRLGTARMYEVQLSEEDYFPIEITSTGQAKYGLPTSVEADSIELTMCESIQDLLVRLPDGIAESITATYSDETVWDSTVGTYVNPPIPERLSIEVSESTHFYRRNTSNFASGKHQVVIEGLDENWLSLIEHVDILDDGIYQTQNWFRTVTKVWLEGFDGDVRVFWGGFQSYIVDPYRVAVTDSNEGPLWLNLIYDNEVTYLASYTPVFKAGEEYRTGTEPIDNILQLYNLTLLSVAEETYEGIDLCISHEDSRLYVLAIGGIIYVYDLILPSFTPPITNSSLDTYIELQALEPYVRYLDTSKMFTYFARQRFPILKVQIKKISPSSTIEYLTADKTWTATETTITCPSSETIEGSWIDIQFETEYDELGQWEYVCIVETAYDTTTYVTCVQASSLTALAALDVDEDSIACWWNCRGKLSTRNEDTVFDYEFANHGWLPDYQQQRILTASPFSELEVTY